MCMTDFTKALRKNATDAEKILWYHLRARRFFGYKFRRQVRVEQYIVDFICFEKKLVIELDGGQHAEPSEQNLDQKRTFDLERLGFQVLRFWNHDVFENLDGVLMRILETLKREKDSYSFT